jgi:heptosyltransferase II
LEKTAGAPGRIVGVSPGAAFGSAKRWPPGRFAEAAAELAAKLDCTVAVFGSKDERELCEHVARLVEARGLTVKNFAGQTTLRDFIELVAGCLVYLTNDSGGMHVACALGVPTVAVFGSTDETATGPVGAWTRVVRDPVDCSPCLLRECPTDHRCMERVAAGRVVEAALELVRS